VWFEELRNTSEEKDTSIAELQQAAETVHADLETEKKQVEGELPPPTLFLSIVLFC
jgi:predicted transcriptional regulator